MSVGGLVDEVGEISPQNRTKGQRDGTMERRERIRGLVSKDQHLSDQEQFQNTERKKLPKKLCKKTTKPQMVGLHIARLYAKCLVQ